MDEPSWVELLVERICQQSGIGIFPIGKSVITADEYDFLYAASPFLRKIILGKWLLEKPFKVQVERRCLRCGGVYKSESSSKYLPTRIEMEASDNHKRICEGCKLIEKIEEENRKRASGFYEKEKERRILEKRRREDEARKLRIEQNNLRLKRTEEFIAKYLQKGDFREKSHKNFDVVYDALYGKDLSTIKAFILKMPYKDFLNTPYWKALSRKVLFRAGYKCQVCGSQGMLNCHHRSYENHGDEYYHLNDLVCLCTKCHNKFHGVKS